MAIPEKRHLGTWVRWLGVILFSTLAIVVVPQDRLTRAVSAISDARAGTMSFDKYRALLGLLEHLRSVGRWPRSVMYGLYEPHRAEAIHTRFGSVRVVNSCSGESDSTDGDDRRTAMGHPKRVTGGTLFSLLAPLRLTLPDERVTTCRLWPSWLLTSRVVSSQVTVFTGFPTGVLLPRRSFLSSPPLGCLRVSRWHDMR